MDPGGLHLGKVSYNAVYKRYLYKKKNCIRICPDCRFRQETHLRFENRSENETGHMQKLRCCV